MIIFEIFLEIFCIGLRNCENTMMKVIKISPESAFSVPPKIILPPNQTRLKRTPAPIVSFKSGERFFFLAVLVRAFDASNWFS